MYSLLSRLDGDILVLVSTCEKLKEAPQPKMGQAAVELSLTFHIAHIHDDTMLLYKLACTA